MRILVLEYSVGVCPEVDFRLFPEGFAMLCTMAAEFMQAGCEVITTLHKDLTVFRPWLAGSTVFFAHELAVALQEKPDAAFPIAPAKELARLSAKLTALGMTVLGSPSEVVNLAGDKWKTYQRLQGLVCQPGSWARNSGVEYPGFTDAYSRETAVWGSNNTQLLKKPRRGEGCNGITRIFSPQNEVSKFLKGSRNEHRWMLQEYIPGTPGSACLLSGPEGSQLLSINQQFVIPATAGFLYVGGIVSGNVASGVGAGVEGGRKAGAVKEMAQKIVKALGVIGFCGIDFIASSTDGKIYFLELNPRLTTSFIGLCKIFPGNLARLLLEKCFAGEVCQKTSQYWLGDTFAKNPDGISALPLEGSDLVAVVRLVRVNREVRIRVNKIQQLLAFPEIAAPPPCEQLLPGMVLCVVVGFGCCVAAIEAELKKKTVEVAKMLGVGQDEIIWN